MYADYTFYTDDFYGTAISQEDFPRLFSRASDFLDYYTRGKAAGATEENVLTALSKACCAVAEQMQTDEKQKDLAVLAVEKAMSATSGQLAGQPDHELKSETVGSWSGSYVTSADYAAKSAADALKDANTAYAAIAFQYLANTGLLYRGGCC